MIRKFSTKFYLLSVLLLTFFLTPKALSYQCEPPFRQASDESKEASKIFVGKVVKIHSPIPGGRIPVNFEINKPIKGEFKPQIQVLFNTLDNGPAPCNKIQLGGTYLVYAFVRGSDFVSEICTRGVLGRKCNRTVNLESAKEDLKFLDSSQGVRK